MTDDSDDVRDSRYPDCPACSIKNDGRQPDYAKMSPRQLAEHDLRHAYAHGDPEAIRSTAWGWAQRFAKHLEAALAREDAHRANRKPLTVDYVLSQISNPEAIFTFVNEAFGLRTTKELYEHWVRENPGVAADLVALEAAQAADVQGCVDALRPYIGQPLDNALNQKWLALMDALQGTMPPRKHESYENYRRRLLDHAGKLVNGLSGCS